MKKYTVYILECQDKTLYTGITTDIKRRVYEHNHTVKGAKYTTMRRPVTLKYAELVADKSTALKREYKLRHLSRAAKLDLISKNAKMG